MGIAPYGVGKMPVGRGLRAPPLGVRCVLAAGHTGGARQGGFLKVCRGSGSAPPDDGHRIFKECHSEERSDVGIRFPVL